MGKYMQWRIIGISLVVWIACVCVVAESTNPADPEQVEYAPPSGRGPLVILLSGISGLDRYRNYAADVARLGYYTVLLKGIDFNPRNGKPGGDDLRRTIVRAQSNAKALPGKVAVIGFSFGGGVSITHAAGMPDLVSAIVVYYPMTDHIKDMRSFVAAFKVPILVLAGERDTYYNCCLIKSMRAMEAEARGGKAPFELVVYKEAGHAFNLADWGGYRAEDSADAWQRTIKMLGQYQPLR